MATANMVRASMVAVVLLGETMHQQRDYASFSSLIWVRVPGSPHRWRWKHYEVWGEGCTDTDLKQHPCTGGIWTASVGPCVQYRSQMDAQAAVETFHLEYHPPEASMDDVELVWEYLNELTATTFEDLVVQTGLNESELSEALAHGYELNLIHVSIVQRARVGYLRAPRRK